LIALSDAVSKLNVVPCKHLNWATLYIKWFGISYDFLSKPQLPFGCKVMAQTSVKNQSKLSPNSIIHYYVGTTPHIKQGIHTHIVLYNPITKQVIIRRSYQALYHNIDQELPTLQLQLYSPTSTDNNNKQFHHTTTLELLTTTHHPFLGSPEC